MNIYFVDKMSEGDVDNQLYAMRDAGFKFTTLAEADFIYVAAISQMKKAIHTRNTSGKPMIVYCWDYYLWSHGKINMSGDWNVYADGLRMAEIIFVPSKGQQLRLKELLGLRSYVVRTGIPVREIDKPIYTGEISDGGFILDPLRHYPEENETWAEDAAKELGIPLIHTEHGHSPEEFHKLVETCRFTVCAVREASTGTLTVAEALYLGKPALLSNSPYQGGWDYVGKYARPFQYDDFEDLKRVMKEMWENTPKVDLLKARAYLDRRCSYKQMAEGMIKIMRKHLGGMEGK